MRIFLTQYKALWWKGYFPWLFLLTGILWYCRWVKHRFEQNPRSLSHCNCTGSMRSNWVFLRPAGSQNWEESHNVVRYFVIYGPHQWSDRSLAQYYIRKCASWHMEGYSHWRFFQTVGARWVLTSSGSLSRVLKKYMLLTFAAITWDAGAFQIFMWDHMVSEVEILWGWRLCDAERVTTLSRESKEQWCARYQKSWGKSWVFWCYFDQFKMSEPNIMVPRPGTGWSTELGHLYLQ